MNPITKLRSSFDIILRKCTQKHAIISLIKTKMSLNETNVNEMIEL